MYLPFGKIYLTSDITLGAPPPLHHSFYTHSFYTPLYAPFYAAAKRISSCAVRIRRNIVSG